MESPKSWDGLTGEEIYCICRSTDCSRFMIGCDRCNEWYHGDCINITQEESSDIKHFYCHLCRGKDPTLKIKYKHKKKKDKEKEREKFRKEKNKYRKDRDKKHHSDKHSDKHRDPDRKKSSDKSRHGDPVKKHKEVSSKPKDPDRLKVPAAKEIKPSEPQPEKAKPPTEEKSPAKPPPPAPAPVATVMDISDFMDVDDELDDVDLEDIPTSEQEEQLKKLLAEIMPGNHTMLSRAAAAKKSTRRCGECVSCIRTEDCARCDFCKDMRKFGGPNRIRQKCRLRQCLNFGLLKTQALRMKALAEKAMAGVERSVTSVTEDQFTMFVSDSENEDRDVLGMHRTPPKKHHRRSESEYSSTPGRKKTKEKGKKYDKKQKKAPNKEPKARSKRKAEEDFEDVLLKVEEDQSPRQCLGPGCTELAREGSKYCSDDCGMKLATNRIFEILPQRIQQWQVIPCIAEENNKLSLETIRRQQLQARQKLVELDLKHQELDALIVRAKRTVHVPDPEQDNTDAEEEGEHTIHCVTCGHEIPQRLAIRHMERCFTKFESQTSFGSIYKTKIEGNSMFCDFYNAQAKTYCKRLKVLCPEHSKEPKTAANEVCGCPLLKSNTFEDTNVLCQTPKLKCNKHYCWEKLRRAEIDMERVRQWMKLDDLFEQERHIRHAMSSRAGVLGLMLHQTIDHNPLRPIKSKS